jgi:hypothetical protein
MENIPAAAENQSVAEIFSEPDNLIFLCIIIYSAGEGREKLHTDINGPSDAVTFGENLNIIAVDNVGMSFHFGHQLILPHHALENRVEMLDDIIPIIAVTDKIFHFTVAFWDRNDFQSGFFGFAEEFPLYFVNGSVAARTNLPNDLPVRKNR